MEKKENCEEKDMMKMFLDLSNCAWMALMKKKIMAAYEKSRGEAMDKLAVIAHDHGMAMWLAKKEGKELSEEQVLDFKKRYEEAMIS